MIKNYEELRLTKFTLAFVGLLTAAYLVFGGAFYKWYGVLPTFALSRQTDDY